MNRIPEGISGSRVLVTCSVQVAAGLLPRLRQAGAVPTHVPLVEIRDPADGFASLDSVISRLSSFSWIVFTSRNGVSAFFSRLRGAKVPDRISFAAVGRGTAEELSRHGFIASVVPERQDAEGLLSALVERLAKGESVLWPRAHDVRDVLAPGLRGAGVAVEEVVSYVTAMPEDLDAVKFVEMIEAGEFDAVLFDSPSAVKNFVEIVGRERAGAFSCRTKFVSIGPVTEEAVRKEIG
ncbi:MAG TPA: uroporphyrinogen-III synthase [bacterium]|nr:uroporphyrinogen-III synthase [bacterium]